MTLMCVAGTGGYLTIFWGYGELNLTKFPKTSFSSSFVKRQDYKNKVNKNSFLNGKKAESFLLGLDYSNYN